MLAPDHMEDKYSALFLPIDDPTGWFNYLTVSPPRELWKSWSTAWVLGELLDMPQDPSDQIRRCDGVIKRYVISDRVEIAYGGLSPDYFSHRPRRCFT